ncbi:ABC transporter permease [Qaidamihabitans albus]|uniref:ABC transporter permease n=1 Tax=Qaidamihabitans albus TaxID=2795733 RepID=UPI0018F252F6|nr:ABC transporter permease [Qaidamihabitans albus]
MNRAAFTAAIAVESRKTLASRVVITSTVLLVAGIAVLAGSLTWAASTGNEQVLAQMGPMADRTGWDRLMGVVAQVTAAAAVLGFGVTVSWMFGREFTDGTITGLFALPVSRPDIALAKLVIYLAWALVVATVLVLLLGLVGLAIDLGPVTGDVLAALARQHALTGLSAVIAIPAALAATLGRGLLPGIATTIGIVVTAQVVVVAGSGAWFPLAAPALWALEPARVTSTQLALVTVVPVIFVPAILATWRRLQLDR